jgi:A/G-specific adenine glycosylase
MTPRHIQKFQKEVYDFYASNKRSFPWRKTKDPYHILVSEIMLQQTQTDRVVPKYEDFIATFPTVESLAQAPLNKVLKHWQGLGYNRRALLLHRAAQSICTDHGGQFPRDQKTLLSLPGIGPYTSGAVVAFAFNKPVTMIETNIRTVYIHHFFSDHGNVHDSELLPLIQETLDAQNPRRWYSALMDYGSSIKKTHPNPNRKSSHYTKQSTFKGSLRQVRGAIIKLLTIQPHTQKLLQTKLDFESAKITHALHTLEKDGMITRNGQSYSIE